MTTGHTLNGSNCGIADWLGMALMSGLAFGLAIVIGLGALALARYTFFGRRAKR